MIDPCKRIVLGVMFALAIAGCGRKDEPGAAPPASAPAAAASVAEAAAPPPEPLKVAWVYRGSVNDAGGTFAHERSRKAMASEFGDKVVTSFVERVAEGAQAEQAMRDLALKGSQLIFATSIGFSEPAMKVAGEFPDVRFALAQGARSSDNLRSYDVRFFEGAYLAGVIAGRMSKTQVLGFVGSVPTPEVLRSINAFALGARSVNPRTRVRLAWVNAWFDPVKEAEAAQNLISGGADVLLQSTDSIAVLQTAERSGAYAFGWAGDMSAYAPKAHLASVVVDWSPLYRKAVRGALDSTWTAEPLVGGVREGQVELVKVAAGVPADVKERVQKLAAAIKDGSFAPFTGPLADAGGKERLARGTVADQAWLDKVDFLVQGVDGKLPARR